MQIDSFSLSQHQLEFVNGYLNEPKSKSLLVAAPGTGKTVTALYTAKELIKLDIVDATLILSDRIAIREQWSNAAKSHGLEFGNSFENSLGRDGVSMNIQSIKSPLDSEYIKNIGKSRRWFIIADEIHYRNKITLELVNRLLEANNKNKSLFLSSVLPKEHTFAAEFRFNSEHIFDRTILELPDTEIRVARFAPSFSLLSKLKGYTPSIDNLTWRQFEKLIASLLEKDGYEVELMQGTKDGGVDVIAVMDLGPSGFFKTLWQAKKNNIKNKVGISIVRELADTRQEFGASKGIIVTSSYLTKGALQRIERDKYILGKVDRDDLNAWVKKTLLGNNYS